MKTKNIVFIGKSLDGYIAGKNGELDWLDMVPNTEKNDMGYNALMDDIDAIVMGKTTFETVLNFDIEWPYEKHVFVLSHSIKGIPKTLKTKVSLLKGDEKEVIKTIHQKGYFNLYIDGGKVIQNFLEQNLIDELRISTLPIILGGGVPLFGALPHPMKFTHIKTEVFLNEIVQSCYERLA